MKSFIRFAVDKPIINHILMVFMLFLSVMAYKNIAKEIFPPSTLDMISITGSYVGASSNVLDKMVVDGLEDELKSMSKIETIYTSIQNGLFHIKADIKHGNSRDLVLLDVKDIVSKARRDLPSDMDEPLVRVVEHEYPLLLIAVSGDVSKEELIDSADKLKSKLSIFSDLSSIDIRGDAENEVVIELNQKKIDAFGLDKASIYKAISNISTIFPAGTIDEKGNHLYISTVNGDTNASSLAKTLIGVNGRYFHLGDIANVRYGLADPIQISHYNGKQNISININKSKEGNAISLSKEIRVVLEEFNKQYDTIEFKAYTDTSIWIKNRLNLVSSNILFGLMLVFLALLLSVNIRIALVVAIGIPASFMITLISMDMIGYSLNMLTLLGALIALGMLVDEAIVVAENIYRHIEMGKSPRDAAIDGAIEMFPAVLTATLTTVFAFLPLLIMSGKMGMFMQVLPVMISVLLVSSLFEAFYFLPLHAKEFFTIKAGHTIQHKSPFWEKKLDNYSQTLHRLLKEKRKSLLLIVSFISIGIVGMSSITKFQLFPEFDAQQIYMSGKVNINNNLVETEEYVSHIEKILLANIDIDEVDSVTSVVGFKLNKDQSYESGENLFQVFINLHEKAPENFFDTYINPIFSLEYDDTDMIRQRTSQQIAKDIELKLIDNLREKKEDGKVIFEELNLYVPQAGIVSHDIEIGFQHHKREVVLSSLKRVKEFLSTINGTEDIVDNANEGELELKLRINEYGEQLGFSEGYVTSILRGAYLNSEYTKMFNEKGLVRVKLEDAYKSNASSVGSFKLKTIDGKQVVRLSDICDFTYKKSFVKIFKEDGEKLRSLFARVEKRVVTTTEVMKRVTPLLDKLRDEGVLVIVKGEEQENKKLEKEMGEALLIAVFLIFITLVWMFNSLVLPLIVISTIPLSILGVLVGTKLMGIHMTMPGAMGVIGLAGVVVNDGLIMLDFIKGSKTYDEVIERARMRFRPIVLTSVTTVLGLSSLMFFASGQALILQPMAISLGFGIAWATLLNLYYVPILYAVIYKVK